MRYAVVDKREGETPLMALEAFRKSAGLADVSLTYAGRLDPMASGKLLVLIGDECKKRAQYDSLDKEYRVEILFGFSSDTGDILGLVERDRAVPNLSFAACAEAVGAVYGKIELPYPAYSSRTVGGKPLFEHARTGSIDTIEIPTKTSHIYAAVCESLRSVTGAELLRDIEQRLAQLVINPEDENPYKDFRKGEVLQRWRENLDEKAVYQIATAYFVVSSGTYMRSLVPHLARTMGTEALAYTIRRTKMGRYIGLWGRGVWVKSY